MKTLFVLLGFLCLSISAKASSLESQMADNIICFREVLYSSAGLVTVHDHSRETTRQVVAIDNDLVQKLIHLVSSYSGQSNVTADEVAQARAACRELKKTTKKVSLTGVLELYGNKHPNLFFPSVKASLLLYPSGLPFDSQRLVESIVYQLERCRGVDVTLALGKGFAGGAGMAVSYCQGHGGKRWYSLAPQAYTGIGVGAAAMIGRKEINRSGWINVIDVDATVMSSFGYIAGGYIALEEQGQSLGVAFGSPGFAFTMVGANTHVKVLPLSDDKKWILKMLGREVAEEQTGTEAREPFPLLAP